MSFDDYKETLFNETKSSHTMKTIRFNRHQIGNYSITKYSLSCFDNKKNNGIDTMAYVHYKIN